jgi:hypothetical protein
MTISKASATVLSLNGSRRSFIGASLATALAGTALAWSSSPARAATKMDAGAELHTAMRKLWEDHITYTRNYIISALGDLDDQKAVVDRLMKNQEDIGGAVEPYYGADAGAKLTKLLKEHISQAADVVGAAKAGDNDKLKTLQEKWSANGREIAAFLAGANPNWPKATLEEMLQKHLDLTTGEVVGRLKKDWASDISSYDKGHEHMLMFADTLSDGIIKQFPDKFA